jgi:hypothetical protein
MAKKAGYTHVLNLVRVFHVVEFGQDPVQQLDGPLHVVASSGTKNDIRQAQRIAFVWILTCPRKELKFFIDLWEKSESSANKFIS